MSVDFLFKIALVVLPGLLLIIVILLVVAAMDRHRKGDVNKRNIKGPRP